MRSRPQGSYDALVGGYTDAGLRDLCGLPCLSLMLPTNDMISRDKDVRVLLNARCERTAHYISRSYWPLVSVQYCHRQAEAVKVISGHLRLPAWTPKPLHCESSWHSTAVPLFLSLTQHVRLNSDATSCGAGGILAPWLAAHTGTLHLNLCS